MQITFNLPQIFHFGSDRAENAEGLAALLGCLVRINIAYLKSMRRRKITVPKLYASGVVYARTVWWEPIPALYERKFGDCKSLSCALVAQYYMEGKQSQPVFRFNPREESTDYHILVQTPKGYEDPSKVLGMGKDENAWFRL